MRNEGMTMQTETTSVAKTKGPIVWLDMDQQELDNAYDQIVYAPNRDQVAKRRLANSVAARARLGAPQRCACRPTRALPPSPPPPLPRGPPPPSRRWGSRCAVRWDSFIATPRNSVAIATGF